MMQGSCRHHQHLAIDRPSPDQQTVLLVRGLGLRLDIGRLSSLGYVLTHAFQRRGVNQPTCCRLPSVGRLSLALLVTLEESFLKDRWMVLGDVFLEFSNPNMFLYEFRTYHINFIQNKHVKLDETCIETQGRFKANLSNVMDVLGCLTSKLHET